MPDRRCFIQYIIGPILLALTLAVFLSASVMAAGTPDGPLKVEKGIQAEPCRLTPQEKHWQRNPESQWPPSRRERIRRCDDQPDPGVFMNRGNIGKTAEKP